MTDFKIISKEITFRKITETYKIEAFGKVFNIDKYYMTDSINDEYESDYEIRQKEDFDKLTDEQQDELTDYIVIDLSVE